MGLFPGRETVTDLHFKGLGSFRVMAPFAELGPEQVEELGLVWVRARVREWVGAPGREQVPGRAAVRALGQALAVLVFQACKP